MKVTKMKKRVVDYFTGTEKFMSDEVDGGTKWVIVEITPTKIQLFTTKKLSNYSLTPEGVGNVKRVLLKTYKIKSKRITLAAKLRFLEAYEEEEKPQRITSTKEGRKALADFEAGV